MSKQAVGFFFVIPILFYVHTPQINLRYLATALPVTSLHINLRWFVAVLPITSTRHFLLQVICLLKKTTHAQFHPVKDTLFH